MQKFLLSVLLIFIITTGCTFDQAKDDSTQENADISKLSTTGSTNQHASNRTKDVLKKYDEITSVAAVNSPKKMVVGAEVRQRSRFHLRSLRKEWKKRIEKAFPNKEIEVTTDQKIVWELKELEKKLQDNDVTKKKLEKEIKRIIRLMKDNA